jgi:hypothetical protein
MPLGDFQWAQVLSVMALSVSLANAYFTFFRKARLKVRLGETLLLQVSENGRLRISPELALHNPGATLGVVHEISCELRKIADDSRERMVWEESLATVFRDENRRRDTRFESFPGVLFVPKGEALIKRLQLSTEHPYEISEGDYELSVAVRSDGTAEKETGITTRLRLMAVDVKFLKENQLGPENTLRRILLFFFRRGPNTNCYLRAPG